MSTWEQRIELNPEVLVGKPVVRGTRVSVEQVLEMIANGVSEADIVRNHPRLTREDILACVAYAADLVSRADPPYPRTPHAQVDAQRGSQT